MAEMQTAETKQPVQKLSHMHEMIVLHMLEDPLKPLSQVAAYFEVTPGWLSQVVNCDMFQARLAEYRERGFEVGVLSIHEKIAAATSLALDRLTENLQHEPDTKVILDTANKLSQRLDYGSTPALQVNVQTNNAFGASKETLAEAREIARRVKASLKPLSGESDETPAQGKVIDSTTAETAEVRPSTA